MDSFVLLKFLTNLVLPPGSIALGVLVGSLLMATGLRRLGKLIAVAAVLEGIALSLPPAADALITPLERQAREAARQAKPCCYSAIVLLGGAVVPASPPAMPKAHLVDGVDRIVYAADLFHQGIAPRIIVSGGRVEPHLYSETEADGMKGLLIQLGVPADAIVKEGKSRNTLENITFVHRMVGDQSVALVTSAYHMPRALKIARRVGLLASSFPTDWTPRWKSRPSWENWVPTLGAEEMSARAIHEFLGLAFDRRVE